MSYFRYYNINSTGLGSLRERSPKIIPSYCLREVHRAGQGEKPMQGLLSLKTCDNTHGVLGGQAVHEDGLQRGGNREFHVTGDIQRILVEASGSEKNT
jgi:hypothetical protein